MTDQQELNKRIAELKGWTNIRHDGFAGGLIGTPFLKVLRSRWELIPDWAGDARGAMELFKEMSQASVFPMLLAYCHVPQQSPFYPIPDEVRFLCKINRWKEDGKEHKGTTPEMAICRAWIAWKEESK